MKRFLIILLTSLLILSCLVSCNDPSVPETDESTQSSTQSPEQPPESVPLPIVTGGASDYVIVRQADLRASDDAFKAAVLFRDAIEKLTGVTLQIVTDDVSSYPETAHEILIGDARGVKTFSHPVFVDHEKLYIGGEAQLLSDSVAAFFKSLFDFDVNAQEVPRMDTLSIPSNLTMDQAGQVTSPTVAVDKSAWGDAIAYAYDVANLVNFRYLDQTRDRAEITNGDMRLVYNMAQSQNKQVSGLYNKNGDSYLADSMDAFVVTSDGSVLYSSQSGSKARGNIYRFGYYYYDIHFLDQEFLPSSYMADEDAGSYDLLSKVKRPSSNMLESVKMKDGILSSVVADPYDPYFLWNVNYSADEYNAIMITMRTEYAKNATIYLAAGSAPGLTGEQYVSFAIQPSAEFQTYFVPLSGIKDYTGKVTIMRVDCGEKAGETVEIKEMKAVKINSTLSTSVKLDRNYHVYGDKLHQQIRIVAQEDMQGLSAFGTVTRIEASRVNSLIIADKNGKHNAIDGIDPESIEYLGFDLTDAGVFGYIFPADATYTGSVTVTLTNGYYVIEQKQSSIAQSLKQYDEYSIGHRIYTSTEHSFDELERQAYMERNPLTDIRIVTRRDSATFVGYNQLVGCYTYTLEGTGFNEAYYKDPQKHYIVDTKITGDTYDRQIYVFAHTNTAGSLECGAVLDEADRLLPINVEVCKNFMGEYEEPLFDHEDTHYGYSIFPITVSKNQERHFKSVNLYQNWGQFPIKQISSIQFIAPYYHLSCGVTETNCIAPYYVYSKDYWTLPDFRAMSSPLWSGQPQHTSAGRLYWLQYTDADGNFFGSESQSANISSYGPVYVDIDMSYLSDDGKIQVDYRQIEHAQSDETRTYYTLELTVLEDLMIHDFVNNFSFFSMDGRMIVYKKLGYLDENNQPKTVDLKLEEHTDYYKLGTQGAYFDYYVDADSAHKSTDSVNMAVIIKNSSIVLGGKPYQGNLVLKEQFDGEVNLATLTVDAGDITLRTGDKVILDMILLPWGSPESKDDSNVLGVREDSVLSPINVDPAVGTVVQDPYLPVVIAENNMAEFTVSGGGSTVYAVRIYGFDSYEKPTIQVYENGEWINYNHQHHNYDGYMAHRESDGSYSFSFSFEMNNGQPVTFRVTK